MLRSIERPKPRAVHVPRRGGVSRGLVAILVGTVLVGSGFAVVRYVRPKSDAGGALVENVRSDSAKLVLAVPQSDVPRFSASLRLHTLRENSKLGFGMSAKLTDFHQAADQDVQISLVRTEPRGAVLDVLSSCRAGAQTGHIQDVRSPREIDIYPFAGHSKTLRMVAAADAAPVQVDGTPAVTGRDVPPLLSIGSIGAGARDVAPGVRWKTEIELPVTTDRTAHHLVERFPADVTYVGRATYRGFICAAFKILATAPKTLPEGLAENYDRRQARIAGVVLFELSTGLLAEGSLDVEQKFWKASGDEGEQLKIEGRLELKRQ